MEAEDDEEVNDSNEKSDESRTDVWGGVGGGGGGDEGGGDEQLFQIGRLQQHATSETSFNRWVAPIFVFVNSSENPSSICHIFLSLWQNSIRYIRKNASVGRITDLRQIHTRNYLSAIVVFAWKVPKVRRHMYVRRARDRCRSVPHSADLRRSVAMQHLYLFALPVYYFALHRDSSISRLSIVWFTRSSIL